MLGPFYRTSSYNSREKILCTDFIFNLASSSGLPFCTFSHKVKSVERGLSSRLVPSVFFILKLKRASRIKSLCVMGKTLEDYI